MDRVVHFETQVRERLLAQDHEAWVDYLSLDREAHIAAPTPDHYLLLRDVIALQRPGEAVHFPVEGFDDGGAISMLSARIG